jgi:enoyl-CoA hydratase/carnithine racemase
MTGQIRYTRTRQGVVMLEIDHPPANALGAAIRVQFEQEIDRLESDLTVRPWSSPVATTHFARATICWKS